MPKGIWKRTEKHKQKLFQKGNKIGLGNKSNTGKIHSESHKKHISLLLKGRKHSKEWGEKIGEAQRGEKNHQWKGGIWHNPYSIDWNETLRRSIRERDHYTCQLCGEIQGDRSLSVHHINYIKTNCNPDNLITLCVICNNKVNKDREYWTNYFYAKIDK